MLLLLLLLAAAPALFLVLVQAQSPPPFDPTEYVNPLIGTINGGHVFAGSSTPFGSVKVVADSVSKDNLGGYVADNSPILGMSQMHDSGTGGSASLGVFALLPQYCTLTENQSAPTDTDCRWIRPYPKDDGKLGTNHRAVQQVADSVRAAPGFFGISLASGIDVALTSTDHVALHRYDFSNALAGKAKHGNTDTDTASPTVLFDLTGDLASTFRGGAKMDIDISHDRVARITAQGTFLPSFGAGDYTVYTCADVPNVKRVATYLNDKLALRPARTRTSFTVPEWGAEAGAILELDRDALARDGGEALVRVGMSWVSAAAACRYAQAEIPDFGAIDTFKRVSESARAAWRSILAVMQPDTDGVSSDSLELFYSSLYRSFLAPVNVTGDNPRWDSAEPAYDSLYCLWDSARVIHPMWTIFHPAAQAEVVRAVVDIYRNLGFLPDCRMSTDKGFTQGGSNADMMLSDSFVKGIRDRIDWNDGLAAMLKDANVEPPDWALEGRGAVAARNKHGYVPRGPEGSPATPRAVAGRSASRTLEYAYNDFSIALVGAGLGRGDTYTEYVRRSADSFKLWNAETTSDGFRGFIQARYANGTFHYQDPKRCSPDFEGPKCYLGSEYDTDFYEASAWQYSLYMPHDMATTVGLMGGDAEFIRRVEHMWERGYADVGNEPAFLAQFATHYAKGGYRYSVDRTLGNLRQYFNTTVGGIPGNDDSGSMGSFAVWIHMGMFPVAGTGVYLLSTPLFPSYRITSPLTGKTFTLTTKNWDGARRNKYITRATVNGQPTTRNWICHSLFTDGATLDLELGPDPGAFGAAYADLPPSLSTDGFKPDAEFLGC